MVIDTKKLASLVKRKRGKKSLRKVALELKNVSISTLSRIENGQTPDVATLIELCAWLEISILEFVITPNFIEKNNQKQIISLLRTDSVLHPEVSDWLVSLIEFVYKV